MNNNYVSTGTVTAGSTATVTAKEQITSDINKLLASLNTVAHEIQDGGLGIERTLIGLLPSSEEKSPPLVIQEGYLYSVYAKLLDTLKVLQGARASQMRLWVELPQQESPMPPRAR